MMELAKMQSKIRAYEQNEKKNIEQLHLRDEEISELKKKIDLLELKENMVSKNKSYLEAKVQKDVDQVKENVVSENAEVLVLAVGTEADINELDDFEERKMFLQDIGLDEPGSAKLIRSAYKLLNLQTYFTAGVKEVRAWTINIGSTAPQSAGVIHTDFEKGFIRAEVINYDDFVNFGSEVKVKEAGKMRVEGKNYTVKDGDIMHFLFNV